MFTLKGGSLEACQGKRVISTSTMGSEESIDLSIDQLSLDWKAVVSAVEARAGRRVAVRQQRGLISR